MGPTFSITIVLTGLIAIVPNTTPSAQFAKAYLVKDNMHTPVLRVYGPVKFTSEPGAPACKVIEDCQKGSGVQCDLKDTVVSLGGADDQSNGRVLPMKPSTELPDPHDLSARASRNWIVRMSNIENGIGKVKDDAALATYVTSQITFGWDVMESAELDGSEEGPDKVAKIGFKAGSGAPSSLRQAVAESIRFTTTITQQPRVLISIHNKKNFFSVVVAKCSTFNCFTLEVDNSAPDYQACPVEEGIHFDKYYNLVESAGDRMLPYSVDPRACVVGGGRVLDRQLLNVGADLLSPAIPKVAAEIRAGSIPLAEGKRKNLPKIVSKQSKASPKQKACATDLLLHILEVQNRVICPPVVLEP